MSEIDENFIWTDFVEKVVTLLREQNEQFERIEKSLDRIENLLRGGAGK